MKVSFKKVNYLINTNIKTFLKNMQSYKFNKIHNVNNRYIINFYKESNIKLNNIYFSTYKRFSKINKSTNDILYEKDRLKNFSSNFELNNTSNKYIIIEKVIYFLLNNYNI